MQRVIKKFVPTLLVLSSCGLNVQATTYGDDPPVEAALRHAESVIAGFLSNRGTPHEEVLKNVTNEKGEFQELAVKYMSYEFNVSEIIDGEKVPNTIRINIRGALELPSPKDRVVVGIMVDHGRPESYAILYSRIVPASSDAELEHARKLTMKARAKSINDIQTLIDRYGEEELARRRMPARAEDDPNPEKQREFQKGERSVPKEAIPSGIKENPKEKKDSEDADRRNSEK